MFKFIRKHFGIYIPTLIITFSNILSFMLVQTIFFWFVASNNIYNIIDNKSGLVVEFIEIYPELREVISDFVNSSEYEEIKSTAIRAIEERNINNTMLLYNWMIPPFSIISSILASLILIEIFVNRQFDLIDLKILSTVFLSFTTEIIFYFIVINNSEIISDIDVLLASYNALDNLDLQFDITSIYNGTNV